MIDRIADLNVDSHAIANDTGAASHLRDMSDHLTGGTASRLRVLGVAGKGIDNRRV